MSSLPPTPHFRLIKGLVIAGALFVAFIVISASQEPRSGILTLEDAAKKVSGFHLSAPGAPRPNFLKSAVEAPEARPDDIAVFYWPPGCGVKCENDAAKFINVMKESRAFSPYLARVLNPKAANIWRETLPAGVTGLSFYAGEAGNLLSQSPESLVIFYSNGSELGRGRGIDWSRAETHSLIRALEVTHLRDL